MNGISRRTSQGWWSCHARIALFLSLMWVGVRRFSLSGSFTLCCLFVTRPDLPRKKNPLLRLFSGRDTRHSPRVRTRGVSYIGCQKTNTQFRLSQVVPKLRLFFFSRSQGGLFLFWQSLRGAQKFELFVLWISSVWEAHVCVHQVSRSVKVSGAVLWTKVRQMALSVAADGGWYRETNFRGGGAKQVLCNGYTLAVCRQCCQVGSYFSGITCFCKINKLALFRDVKFLVVASAGFKMWSKWCFFFVLEDYF